MAIRARLVAAGAAATLITGAAVATAATPGSSSSPSASSPAAAAKPGAAGTGAPGAAKARGSDLATLQQAATQLHVSVPRLLDALDDAKRAAAAVGDNPLGTAAVDAVVHDLGVSQGEARSVLQQFFGPGAASQGKTGPGPSQPTASGPATANPALAAALANALGITPARAAAAIVQLQQIAAADKDGRSITDSALQTVATGLHITAQRLEQALTQAKQSLAGSGSRAASPGAKG